MSVWSDHISFPQQTCIWNLVFDIMKKTSSVLVFAYKWQTGSWYWCHCTVTTTDSTIHCSRCLEKENTDYLNVLFQYTCEIYWCSETVSHVTPCTIFCFNTHVRYTDVLKLYHMSLHVQYSVQYTCEIYWCSETVSHVTPRTILCFNTHARYTDVLKLYHMSLRVQNCFNIHVRYTDVLKLYHMSLHIQYSVSIIMWDILMFW